MSSTTETEKWGGRALPRFEDEALLRGEGRFIDDLDPVPNVRHAAILRSLVPHARIAALDVSAALELPGVVGVLTGAEVAAMSRPFPAGIESAVPAVPGIESTAVTGRDERIDPGPGQLDDELVPRGQHREDPAADLQRR